MKRFFNKIGSGVKKGIGAVTSVGEKVLSLFDDGSINVQIQPSGTKVVYEKTKVPEDRTIITSMLPTGFGISNILPYLLLGFGIWFIAKKMR